MSRAFVLSSPQWCVAGDQEQIWVLPSDVPLEFVDTKERWGGQWLEILIPGQYAHGEALSSEFPVSVGRFVDSEPTRTTLAPVTHAEAMRLMREAGVEDLSSLESFDPDNATWGDSLDQDDDWRAPEEQHPSQDHDPRYSTKRASARDIFRDTLQTPAAPLIPLPANLTTLLDSAQAYWRWYLGELDRVTTPAGFSAAPAEDRGQREHEVWGLRRHWPDTHVPAPLVDDLERLWGSTMRRIGPEANPAFTLAVTEPLGIFKQVAATPWFTVHGPYAHPGLDDLPQYLLRDIHGLAAGGTPVPRPLLDVLVTTSELAPRWLATSYGGTLVGRRDVPAPLLQAWGEALVAAGVLSEPPGLPRTPREGLGWVARAGAVQLGTWLRQYGTTWFTSCWSLDANHDVEAYQRLRATRTNAPTAKQAVSALRRAARWYQGDTFAAANALGLEVRAGR